MDPEEVLARNQQAAVAVPFNVCEEETITVVVGWENRDAQLGIEVTTPLGATVTSASPGMESSSPRTWTFLRVPLPHGGEPDRTRKVTMFRPRGGGVGCPAPSRGGRYFSQVVA